MLFRSSLLGVSGALMALPVAATIQALIGAYMHRHEVVDSPLTVDPRAAAESAEADKAAEVRTGAGEEGAGDTGAEALEAGTGEGKGVG